MVFEPESVGRRGTFGNGRKGGICMTLAVVIGLETRTTGEAGRRIRHDVEVHL